MSLAAFNLNLTADELLIVRTVCLAISLVSLAASLCSMYWFTRMKRSFRHDLIMLLVLADLVKSLVFVIFSVVALSSSTTIPNESAFCQASGFFFALGIEASDSAALLIAVHVTLYIFGTRKSHGEKGLFPHRRLAYAWYSLSALTMAALAWAVGSPGYGNLGYLCYLPLAPWWNRMVLSWIPRYLTAIFIFGGYFSIYLYIRTKFAHFGDPTKSGSMPSSRRSSTTPLKPMEKVYRRASAIMGRHAEPMESSIALTEKNGFDSIGPLLPDTDTPTSQEGEITRPAIVFAGLDAGSQTGSVISEECRSPIRSSLRKFSDDSTFGPSSPLNTRSRKVSWVNTEGANSDLIETIWEPAPVLKSAYPHSHKGEIAQLETQSADAPVNHRPAATRSASFASQGTGIAYLNDTVLSSVDRHRNRVRSQLRLLFIYPFVYVAIWTGPFISDIWRRVATASSPRPFWVLMLGLAMLTSQGAVDSIIFCIREKPWQSARAPRDATNGKEDSLQEAFRGGPSSFLAYFRRSQGGRTREEMAHDNANAMLRRNQELEEENDKIGAGERPGGTGRQWWDAEF